MKEGERCRGETWGSHGGRQRKKKKKGDRIDGEKDVEGEQVREKKGEIERGGYGEGKEDRGSR